MVRVSSKLRWASYPRLLVRSTCDSGAGFSWSEPLGVYTRMHFDANAYGAWCKQTMANSSTHNRGKSRIVPV